MPKGSRQRRLKKERERQRRRAGQAGAPAGSASGAGFGFGFGPEPGFAAPPSPRERAAATVGEAVDALCAGQQARYDSCVSKLAGTESPAWTKNVSRCLAGAVQASVTNAWRHGWQPAELVRQIDRELTQAHASMLADMITAEMRGYAAATVDARWAAQVDGLPVAVPDAGDADYLTRWREKAGAKTTLGGMLGTVATAVETLHQLQHLGALEKLLPLPGTATRPRAPGKTAKSPNPADDRVLGKIRALLSKAESTEFPEEAEALSGRAQALMAKYSIDHALLAAAEGDEEKPGGRRIPVDNPYESPKVQLLTEVARANRCRPVWLKELGLVTVVGFEADLDAVELLFTSLLVQASSAMMRTGAKKDQAGRSRTRAFRQSFLISYAYRIGERLADAADSAVREATEEESARDSGAAPAGPGTALVPLLAAREEAVDDALEEMFGGSLVKTRAARVTDAEGWASGRAAADLASLTSREEVPE